MVMDSKLIPPVLAMSQSAILTGQGDDDMGVYRLKIGCLRFQDVGAGGIPQCSQKDVVANLRYC